MARKQPKVWTAAEATPAKVSAAEKQVIVAACDEFLETVLKPRFMREIRPTEFNYPVDILGTWVSGGYRFAQRYRSGNAHNLGEEFDAPFAKVKYTGPDRFDILWMRHTGNWWKLHSGKTLNEALHILETDGTLHPS